MRKTLTFISFLAILAIALLFNLYEDVKSNYLPRTQNVSTTTKIKPIQTTTIIVGGDVMLGRSVNAKSVRENNFIWFGEDIQDYLQTADITAVNLESPIVENCPSTNEGMVFCGDSRMLVGLKEMGIDIVGLENNHILNYGKKGLDQTKWYVEKAGLKWCDQKDLAVVKNNETLFGFLALDDVSHTLDTNDVRKVVSASKMTVDVLLVMIHWGEEYQDTNNHRQQQLAEVITNAGADVIIGSHPHWVQNYTTINNKPVFFSLGNLIFDQMWSEKTRAGQLLKLEFKGRDLHNFSLVNTFIHDYGRAIILDDISKDI